MKKSLEKLNVTQTILMKSDEQTANGNYEMRENK